MRIPVLVLILAACGSSTPPPPAAPAPVPEPPHAKPPMTLAESGIVPEWLDRNADPCQDFFEHACGTFVRTAVIPPDRPGWSATAIVTKQNEDLLHEVLDKAAREKGNKIGDYYAACLDEAAAERDGLRPLAPLLDAIAAVKDAAGARAAVIELASAGVDAFFYTTPTPDYADATLMIAGIDQAGLGLPDRDYYLKDDGNMKSVRATYREHVARTLALAGLGSGVDDVMRIETAIARLHQDQVARRDPHNLYHRIDLPGVMVAAPTFPWKEYLARQGAPGATAITVNDPKALGGVVKLIDREKPAAIRAYLTMRVLDVLGDELGKAFVDEAAVMDRTLRGVQQVPPRWRRCLERVDRDLGELLGKDYVAQRFAGDSKPRAVDLTRSVLLAMGSELDALPWMDAETRAAAHRKLDKMGYLVGYPDKWRSYDFEVTRESHGKNALTAARFEVARQMAKIGKPVDRSEWTMTPPTVNAYYEPTLNEFALPAGILQPPFFGASFHPAVNFGGTGGSTIGHEMTHGFDDEGSQFDGDGNLKQWWTKPTRQQFDDAAQCVKDQYGQYEAVPGVKLNGALTAGENIADVGGVKIGFQAYQAWKAKQPAPPPAEVGGYSDEQLYFLSYGQSWCAKLSPELLETMAHSNPHSPPRWRVNGVVVDQPGFAAAFKCKVGTPMNPGKMCSVW